MPKTVISNLDPDLFDNDFVLSMEIYPFLPSNQNYTVIAQIVNQNGIALEVADSPEGMNL